MEWERRHWTRGVRQEAWEGDLRQEIWDSRFETRDKRRKTGYGGQEIGEERQDMGDIYRRQEKGNWR